MSQKGQPRKSDIVQVIDRAALIENILNQIIVGFCTPRKDAWIFMWNVVLDTSVMPLGAKVKVAMAAAHELNFKLNRDALHTVVSLRNAFAHHASDAHPVFVVSRERNKGKNYFLLHVLESSGKLSHLKRDEALDKFNKAYTSAKESLVELNGKIRIKYKEASA